MKTKWLYLSDNEIARLFKKATNRRIIVFEKSAWILMQKKIDSFLTENK